MRAKPRQAVRWIGDAFVLPGDLATGAPAVWRTPRETRCAKVRIAEMTFDWEFDVDEGPLYRAAAELKGAHVVPRLATYREQDLVAMIDDDVGDVTLAQLVSALHDEHGDTPRDLVRHILRACMTACSHDAAVRMNLRPQEILIAWDGGIWLRPTQRPAIDVDELDSDDPRGDLLYDGENQHRSLGVLGFELIHGRDPYGARPASEDDDGEDDAADDDENDEDALEEAAERWRNGEHDESGDELVDTLLRGERVDIPITPYDVAGLLDGLFAARKRACLEEREDRLLVMPGAKVEPEAWAPLAEVEDEEEIYDLDDVRRGHPDFRDGARYEPSVEAVDPFEDE